MASQASYTHNGSHQRNVRQISQPFAHEGPRSDRGVSQFYHLQASINSPDSGQYIGATREMGPPPSFPSDFPLPTRPIEMEVNSSRTLPNPAASSSGPWDSFSSTGVGGFSDFGLSNVGRPVDSQIRGNAADPILQWYNGNDGPWTPKGISVLSEERLQPRVRVGNRVPVPYGNQFRRPNPSDAGSFHYGGVAPSDSGYATRHSDENTSVFSTDINDRDQDCQSLVGHVSDFQRFQGLNHDSTQPRDTRVNDAWAVVPKSSPSNSSNLVCPTCQKPVKTKSELKKHDFRHRKPFVCKYPGCTRPEGFSTNNDLERHTKSKHPEACSSLESTKKFRCHVQGCKSKDKSWPRLDNFRSHLKRLHSHVLQNEQDFEAMLSQAEFVEPASHVMAQEVPSPQKLSLPNESRAAEPVVQDAISRDRNTQPNWKPIYPEVIEPSHELLVRKEPTLEEDSQDFTPDSDAPSLDVRPQETVQPLDVIRKNPSSLGSILLAPVGTSNSVITPAERAVVPTPAHPSRVSPHAKATRLNEVSASEAAEAIATALAGAEMPDESEGRNLRHDLDRGKLPSGKIPGGTCSNGLNPAMSAIGKLTGHANSTSSPAVQEDSKSLQERKAREVLKTLRDLGYIVQKDPTYSPKIQNPGSAASNKSENLVTCQTCTKFKGRPCELKKHMKRHSRPYGCTFLTCNKTFGSKNDWKRHENSQHFHLETWRCDVEKLEGGECAKVCYRRQSFQDHLKKDHHISDAADVKSRIENCRIGRNCQTRFWCGFCTKLIVLTKTGVDAWTERFDHIDDHFMGRREFTKQSIQDWIPVDSDKPKGDVESPLDLSPGNESHESPSDHSSSGHPSGHSPEASGAAVASPANIMNESVQGGSKRSRSSSDDDSRPVKHHKPARLDTLVHCCQCQAAHNPKLESRCTVCEDSHAFCNNCKHSIRPFGQDKPSEP